LPEYWPINLGIRQPIGNKEAGFSPLKLDCSEFCVRIPIFWKYVYKSASIRPVTGTVLETCYARIEPDFRFEPILVYEV